jgi:hypothetical protein
LSRKNIGEGGAAIKVYIDSKLEIKLLRLGKYYSRTLDSGNHRLYLAVGETGQKIHTSRSLEFTGDDNEMTFLVDVPRAQDATNADAWIVNKEKETEPGTLHKMEDFKL